ncbi:MAG TPA: hypothetical protein VGG94_05040 [Chthoniobacterales bacterium]|jgi:hypothetical protein
MIARAKKLAAVLALMAPFLLSGAAAQQPAPQLVVVQAANTPGNSQEVARPAAAQDNNASSSLEAALKALQQTKAVNDETLKKQEALLEQLDELQKAAEQMKIFAKRG